MRKIEEFRGGVRKVVTYFRHTILVLWYELYTPPVTNTNGLEMGESINYWPVMAATLCQNLKEPELSAPMPYNDRYKRKRNIRASFHQSSVRRHRPDIWFICRSLVEKHLCVIRAPMIPNWCGICRIKFHIRIHGEDDI